MSIAGRILTTAGTDTIPTRSSRAHGRCSRRAGHACSSGATVRLSAREPVGDGGAAGDSGRALVGRRLGRRPARRWTGPTASSTSWPRSSSPYAAPRLRAKPPACRETLPPSRKTPHGADVHADLRWRGAARLLASPGSLLQAPRPAGQAWPKLPAASTRWCWTSTTWMSSTVRSSSNRCIALSTNVFWQGIDPA